MTCMGCKEVDVTFDSITVVAIMRAVQHVTAMCGFLGSGYMSFWILCQIELDAVS